MKFDNALDHVQLRNGSALMGEVKNEVFHLRLDDTGTELPIENKHIISIVFASETGLPFDRVSLKVGSQLMGKVLDDTIYFTSEGTGDLKLPTGSVLALQLMYDFVVGPWK